MFFQYQLAIPTPHFAPEKQQTSIVSRQSQCNPPLCFIKLEPQTRNAQQFDQKLFCAILKQFAEKLFCLNLLQCFDHFADKANLAFISIVREVHWNPLDIQQHRKATITAKQGGRKFGHNWLHHKKIHQSLKKERKNYSSLLHHIYFPYPTQNTQTHTTDQKTMRSKVIKETRISTTTTNTLKQTIGRPNVTNQILKLTVRWPNCHNHCSEPSSTAVAPSKPTCKQPRPKHKATKLSEQQPGIVDQF